MSAHDVTHDRGGARAAPQREREALTPREQLDQLIGLADLETRGLAVTLDKLQNADDPAAWDTAHADLAKARDRAAQRLASARAHLATHADAAGDAAAKLAEIEQRQSETQRAAETLPPRPDGIARVALEADLDAVLARSKTRDPELPISDHVRACNDEIIAIVDRLSPEDWDRLVSRMKQPRDGDALATWLASRGVRAQIESRARNPKRRHVQRLALADEQAPDGAPLPSAQRGRLEATAGRSLDAVRVRDDDAAQELAASHDARAVTIGQTIHLGAGEDLSSPSGQRLLAHETAHTVQQAQSGQEAPAAKPLATTTPADPAELEADRFADAAMSGRSFSIATTLGSVAALERKGDHDGQTADELSRDRDGENAYMTVRAYDAHGGLVDLWTGPAYFYGDLPAEYVATKTRGRWRWTRGGQPDRHGDDLKVDSDKRGKAGMPIGQWAPDSATHVMVSVHGLSNPFENHVVVDPSGPLTMIGRITEQTADGAEPADPEAPGRVSGPLEPGAIARSGELSIEQYERSTTFRLGGSVLEVAAPKVLADYAFTVEPQTSPRQRAVEIIGVEGVNVRLDNDAESAQLIYHLRHVPPGQVPKAGAGGSAAMPQIIVVGDGARCDLLLEDSRIHIEAAQPGARFAYWIDAEWSGEHGEDRAVHIVATPGVRIDELAETHGSRRLVANPIYVQDPDRVPKQGTPIDPAEYLGAESLQYGAAEREAATVFTGADSVTIRDHDRGAYVSLTVIDPEEGGRFAWTLDRGSDGGAPAFRVLVGPGVHVHAHEVTEPGPMRPPTLPYQDFGVTIDLHQTDDTEKIPPQGTDLSADLLAGFPARLPDSRSFADPVTAFERGVEVGGQLAGDLVIGVIPGIGEAVDFAEVAAGVDKWGNELTTGERIAAGVAAILPFVPGAIAKVGRAARGLLRAEGEIAELAAALGKTDAEIEALLAALRGLDDDAVAAARNVDDAIRTGGSVDPADIARVDRGLRAIGLGGIPDNARGGLRVIDDPAAPTVKAPEGVSPEDLERAGGTGGAASSAASEAERAAPKPRVMELPRSEVPVHLAEHRARGAEVRRIESPDDNRYEVEYPDGRRVEIVEAKAAQASDAAPTAEEAAANRAIADRAAEIQARRDEQFTARNRQRGVVVTDTVIAGAGQTGTLANASWHGSGRAVPGVDVEDVPSVFNIAPGGGTFTHHGDFPIGQKPREVGAGKFTSDHDKYVGADDFVRSVTMTGYESGMVTHKAAVSRVELRPEGGWGTGVPSAAEGKPIRLTADDGTTFYVDSYVSATGLGPPRPTSLANQDELVATGRLVFAQEQLTVPGANTVVVVGDGATGAWAAEAALKAKASKVYWAGLPSTKQPPAVVMAELSALGLTPEQIATFHRAYNDRNSPTFKQIKSKTIELRMNFSAATVDPTTNRLKVTLDGDVVEADGIVVAAGQNLALPEGMTPEVMKFRSVIREHDGRERLVAVEAVTPDDRQPLNIKVGGAQMVMFARPDNAKWFLEGEYERFTDMLGRQMADAPKDSAGVPGSIYQTNIDIPLAMDDAP